MGSVARQIFGNTLRINRIILNSFITQLRKSIFRGFLSESLSQSMGMIKFLLFAVYLVPADLANAKIITSIGGVIFLVSSMGTSSYILREKIIKTLILNRLFTFSVGIACALFLVSIFVSMFLYAELSKQIVLLNFFWIALFTLVSLMEIIHLSLIQRRLDTKRFAHARNIKSLSGLLLAYAFLLLDFDFYAIVISSIGSIAMSWLYCSTYSKYRIGLSNPDKMMLAPLKFSGILGCANLMSFGSNHLLPLIIIYFFDKDLAGYYILAVGIANIVSSIFLYPLHFMLIPILRQQREIGLIDSALNLLRIQATTIAPMLIISIPAAPVVHEIFDTTKWEFAIELFAILMIAQIARCLLLPSNDIFITKGVPVFSLISSFARLCLYLIILGSSAVTEVNFIECIWGLVLADICLMIMMSIGAIFVGSDRRRSDVRFLLGFFFKNSIFLFFIYKIIEWLAYNWSYRFDDFCYFFLIVLFFGLRTYRECRELGRA